MSEHPVPTFCRLELWSAKKQEWTVAHAGVNLLHPNRYPERLAANGKVGRVIVLDTGEIIYGKDLEDIL